MAQRIDVRLRLPSETGEFPILALREGARERTGVVPTDEGRDSGEVGRQRHKAGAGVLSSGSSRGFARSHR